MINVALEGQGARDLAGSRGRRCGQNAALTPLLVAVRPNTSAAPTAEKEQNMNTFATDCEVGQGVEKAAAPLTAPVCLAQVPATTAAPGRLATAQQALPHPMARGGSPAARGPARRSGRGAGPAMPSPAGADAVSDHDLLDGFAAGDADTDRGVRAPVPRPGLRGGHQAARRPRPSRRGSPRGLRASLEARGRLRPGRASVATWLLRITRNLAIDALRRRRAVALGPQMVAALVPAWPATVVEDATVTSELAAQARAALTRLPSAQAKAVWLAASYGHSAQQVAASEGIPLGTAKSRIGRGLRALRAELTHSEAV